MSMGFPKSTAYNTNTAVPALEGVIFEQNRAAESASGRFGLLIAYLCHFSGAPVRSSV